MKSAQQMLRMKERAADADAEDNTWAPGDSVLALWAGNHYCTRPEKFVPLHKEKEMS